MSDITLAVATAVDVAEALCARWEGFRAAPYLCPAGVPTIGFGFTHYPNGRIVTLLDPPVLREEAEQWLRWFIEHEYMSAVSRMCQHIDSLERLGAITDFCFNLGASNLRASTLRKKINAGDWDEVPDQLRRWTRAGGRVLRGLVLRREAEIEYVH